MSEPEPAQLGRGRRAEAFGERVRAEREGEAAEDARRGFIRAASEVADLQRQLDEVSQRRARKRGSHLRAP